MNCSLWQIVNKADIYVNYIILFAIVITVAFESHCVN